MSFELAFPETVDQAVSAHSDSAHWFAGGTDLIPEMNADLVYPPQPDGHMRLVNLKRVNSLAGIEETSEGVRIGALTTLAELADHELIRKNYRALAQACELAASPQIRNMATVGGNLCQESRCPYYRNGFECYRRGGDVCFMREGENREAAVIGYRDCVHVHPSDPANALVVFDAQVVLQSSRGVRRVAAQEFFRAPDAQDRRMNVLSNDELITEIMLPPVAENTRSAYRKAMDRAVWAFALASAAVKIEMREQGIENARVVLGGVAPTPWRELRIEQKLSGAEWNADSDAGLVLDALDEAQPLAHNRYKVRLARAMLKRALDECLA